jgi:DNA-binding transcriptional MerR regulator
MTSIEFCESTGLTPRELQNWLETGLLEAELVVIPGVIGRRREFTAGQVERARVIKALHAKGAKLSQLARAKPQPRTEIYESRLGDAGKGHTLRRVAEECDIGPYK